MTDMLVRWSNTWQFSTFLVFVQLGILVAVALLLARGTRFGPSQKHFVWLTAILVSALLVPLNWLLPSWEIQFAHARQPVELAMQAPSLPSEFRQLPSPDQSNSTRFTAAPSLAHSVSPEASTVAPQIDLVRDNRSSESAPVVLSNSKSWRLPELSPWQCLLGLYLAVVSALVLRLTLACRVLRRIQTERTTPPHVQNQLLSLMSCADLSRQPRLVLSKSVSTPMTYGIWQPTLALPVDFPNWNEEERRVTLAHELSHLKRRDALSDFVASLVRILYWFHPAIYLACRNLQLNRELATDQAAMSLGVEPTAYANQLLRIAANVEQRTTRFSAAIQMAGQHDLKKRIESALATQPSTATSPARQLLFNTCLVMIFLAMASFSIQLSMASPTQQAQQEEAPLFPNEVDNVNVTGDTFYQRVEMTKIAEQSVEDDGHRMDVRGKVSDSDGQPVADAIVILRNNLALTSSDGLVNTVLAKTRSDNNGDFEFRQQALHQTYMNPQVVALTDSGRMGWKSIFVRNDYSTAKTVNVTVEESSPIASALVDASGEAISGATIYLESLRRPLDARRSFDSVNFRNRVTSPKISSDADGYFSFSSIPKGVAVVVSVEHPDYPPHIYGICQSDDIMRSAKTWRGDLPFLKSGEKIVLDPGVTIEGQVLSEGQEVEGAVVRFGYSQYSATTDEDGKFEMVLNRKWLEREKTRLSVRHEDFAVTNFELETSEVTAGSLQLNLLPPAMITGRVLADDMETPIPNVPILVSNEIGSNQVVRSDQTGNFTLPVTPGKISIRLHEKIKGYHFKRDESETTDGRKYLIEAFEVTAGQQKTLDPFVFQRLKPLTIRVVDENDELVKDASVHLISPSGLGLTENSNLESTTMDGLAILAPRDKPAKGSLATAKLVRDGQTFMGEAFVDPDNQETKIKLAPAATAKGRVLLNGEPLPNVNLRFNIHVPKTHTSGMHPASVHWRRLQESRTNELGEYSLAVPQFDAEGNAAVISGGVSSGSPNTEASGVSSRLVRDGLTYQHDVVFKSGDQVIEGTVKNKTGQPITGVTVYIASDSPRLPGSFDPRYRLYQPTMATTDLDGKFQLTGLLPDRNYSIRTLSRNRLLNVLYTEDQATVPAGQKDVQLQIEVQQ